jgi:ketosteroid isomerase-like protein
VPGHRRAQLANWAILAEIWHPDIELELVAGAGTFRGLDEIRPFFDTLSNLYSEYRVEAEEIIDVGDQVVTVERVAGRGLKGSDAATWVEERLFRLISFKQGKIWGVKEFRGRDHALEAAALRESAKP